MAQDLPDDVQERIDSLCEEGNAHLEAEEFAEAISVWKEALKLVPEPKTDWEAGTWIFTSLGDASFLQGDWRQAEQFFRLAVQSPGGVENPFLHLRRGQVFLELGLQDKAVEELTIAITSEGPELFDGEDRKYLSFIKGKIKAPPGGW
jgi:tetratricopeptide (TPR) repeat protein